MDTVGAYEAKTKLSALLQRVEAGESIVITKHGRPVAQLNPVGAAAGPHPPAKPGSKRAREAFRRLEALRARVGWRMTDDEIREAIGRDRDDRRF